MQAEMLDTVVSSNSQELFDFNSEHNGEACIESLRPEDRGTENQFRFTVAMLCVIYDVARKTLEDNIQSLSDDGEFSTADFRRTEKVPVSVHTCFALHASWCQIRRHYHKPRGQALETRSCQRN